VPVPPRAGPAALAAWDLLGGKAFEDACRWLKTTTDPRATWLQGRTLDLQMERLADAANWMDDGAPEQEHIDVIMARAAEKEGR